MTKLSYVCYTSMYSEMVEIWLGFRVSTLFRVYIRSTLYLFSPFLLHIPEKVFDTIGRFASTTLTPHQGQSHFASKCVRAKQNVQFSLSHRVHSDDATNMQFGSFQRDSQHTPPSSKTFFTSNKYAKAI